MLHAVAVIVLIGSRTKLNFFNRDDDLFLFGLVRFLFGLVLELAKVNDLANRRFGIRRDFHQVHSLFARQANRVSRIHDAELLAVIGDHAHLRHANPFINSCYGRAAKIRATAASKTCSYCCTS